MAAIKTKKLTELETVATITPAARLPIVDNDINGKLDNYNMLVSDLTLLAKGDDGPSGPPGSPGVSGLYVGTDPPAGTDQLWLDTDDDTQLNANDVGLGNVDNTSDLAKPISEATQAALDAKTSDLNYVQEFTGASTIVVNHNLNKYPSVTVVDSSGSEVAGDIQYNTINQLTIMFTAATGGKIYCN